jgi:hypothetical protein
MFATGQNCLADKNHEFISRSRNGFFKQPIDMLKGDAGLLAHTSG